MTRCFTFFPNINGHGPYLRTSRWSYPCWGVHRDIYDRWIWQWDLGYIRVSVGWI